MTFLEKIVLIWRYIWGGGHMGANIGVRYGADIGDSEFEIYF